MRSFADTPAKLYRIVKRWYKSMEDDRRLYKLLQDEANNANRDVRYVNMIAEMAEMVENYLTIQSVKTNVEPKNSENALDSKKISLLVDHDLQEMELWNVLEEAASESVYAPIAVVALGRHGGPKSVEIDGEPRSLQEPFAELVGLDDLAIDDNAQSWKLKRGVARRVTITKRAVRQNNPFGRDPEEFMPGEEPPVPVMTREEALQFVMQMPDTNRDESELQDSFVQVYNPALDAEDDSGEVTLWHVAIYYGGEVWEAYIPDIPGQPKKFLLAQRWDAPMRVPDGEGGYVEMGGGHPRGPFEAVTFKPRRGSALGCPGLLCIYDLHQASVKLSAKLVRQLMKMKNVVAYAKGESTAAERIRKAQDQDMIEVGDPRKINTVKYGGADEQLPRGLEVLGSYFSNSGGGVRQLSGAAQAANLATVASYQQGGAQMKINKFRVRLWRLGSAIAQQVTYLRVFGDPAGYHILDMPIDGGVSVPVVFNRAELQADAMDFLVSIRAFTAPSFDPVLQAQRITEFLKLVGMNMSLIQMGLMDAQELAEIGRVVYGIENVDRLLKGLTQGSGAQAVLAAMMQDQGQMGQQMGQQPATGPGQQTRIGAVRSAMAPQLV